MVHKKKENLFYKRLEQQFDELAKKDLRLIKKPSKEEIIRYIDVQSDLQRAYEHHSQLNTL